MAALKRTTEPILRPGSADGRRQTKRKRRIRDLRDAGRSLFVERGVATVTIDNIVDAAGLSKGSFYRYFDNKEALVDAVIEPLRTTVLQATSECTASIEEATSTNELTPLYLTMAQAIASAVVADPEVTLLYLQESRAPALGATRPIRELADEISRRAVILSQVTSQRGLTRVVDSKVSALVVLGAVEKLLFAQLSGDDLGPATEVPSKLVAIILDGIRGEKR